MDINSAEYKLSKAKAQLIIEHPFYASLLCNLPFVEDKSVERMEIDGVSARYNPEYVQKLSLNELKFAEAHAVMRCALSHPQRLGSRDKKKWDKAGDYIINEMLVNDKVGEMPEGALYDPNLVASAGGVAESLYNILPEGDDNDGNGPGKGNSPMDGVQPPPNNEAGQQAEQDWKVRTVQAGQVAKMCGKLSAAAARLVGEIVSPVVPWQKLLERFVSKRAKTNRSFSRPNRRFLAQGLYLPAMSGETLGKIAIAVDCSGSIGQREIDEFAAEIKAIKNTMRPASIDVYYFDSKVSHEETYAPDDELDIRPHGGGGTAFSPIFKAINTKDILPECVVVLTDLYCSDFGPAPEYPVMWVSNGTDSAPWGEVVMMRA